MFTSVARLPQALAERLDDQPPEQADQELFAQYTTAIAACWQWSRGSDLSAVEQALPSYLWGLEQVAHASPKHTQAAAHLLAQGYALRGILAFHRNDLQARADYCRRSVQWARQAGDPTLLVATLATCGSTFHYAGQPLLALQTYQEGLELLDRASPLAQGSLLMKLAETYAQLGQAREAEHSLYRAYRYFPPHPTDDPAFLYADCGEPSLCLWDGLTHLALSQTCTVDERTAQMHLRLAWESLDLFGGAHPRFVVSERNHVEILIQRARTAMALDDLELFIASFSNAVTGAKTLGSQRRRREAITVYWEARTSWPHEERVSDLAELFL
jgi:tetratricopeptide (TPR) repeat protein